MSSFGIRVNETNWAGGVLTLGVRPSQVFSSVGCNLLIYVPLNGVRPGNRGLSSNLSKNTCRVRMP